MRVGARRADGWLVRVRLGDAALEGGGLEALGRVLGADRAAGALSLVGAERTAPLEFDRGVGCCAARDGEEFPERIPLGSEEGRADLADVPALVVVPRVVVPRVVVPRVVVPRAVPGDAVVPRVRVLCGVAFGGVAVPSFPLRAEGDRRIVVVRGGG